MKSSMIRVLFVAVFACVCLLSQSKTASAQPTFEMTVVMDIGSGVFSGEPICLPIEPNCRTERDVFVIEPVGEYGGEYVVTWDLVQGGVRVPFAKGTVRYDARTHFFNGRLLTARDLVRDQEAARSGGSADTTDQDFSLIIYNANSAAGSADSSGMEGVVLQNKIVVRRIKLRRVDPNEVPPTPLD